jgi:hypothetical protein
MISLSAGGSWKDAEYPTWMIPYYLHVTGAPGTTVADLAATSYLVTPYYPVQGLGR